MTNEQKIDSVEGARAIDEICRELVKDLINYVEDLPDGRETDYGFFDLSDETFKFINEELEENPNQRLAEYLIDEAQLKLKKVIKEKLSS